MSNPNDEMSLVEASNAHHRAILDNDDTSSDLSDTEHFLARGAFLLTPATELQLERIGMICEKMNFKGPFSLTKTATGILFKFAEAEDYQATFKKGFHKVTGSRFYKKIPIPCRPQKTFTIFVFEIPHDIPEEDIRHSLYKFRSVVEVGRITSSSGGHSSTGGGSPNAPQTSFGASRSFEKGSRSGGGDNVEMSTEISCMSSSGCVTTSSAPTPAVPSPVRITLASLEECNLLLRDGLDFYGATYFPTEPALSTSITRLAAGKKNSLQNSRLLDLLSDGGMRRLKEALPMFDSMSGHSKIPTPITRTVHSR